MTEPSIAAEAIENLARMRWDESEGDPRWDELPEHPLKASAREDAQGSLEETLEYLAPAIRHSERERMQEALECDAADAEWVYLPDVLRLLASLESPDA